MEKIINVNFQGRVLPIEETAYNKLKQYVDSLRSHFANEEGSEEIIHDIENRIGELLQERLKKGLPCINAADLDAVMDSIGRLEDIEAAEGEDKMPPSQPTNNDNRYGKLYRNADDQVIAGVCSGIASRTGLDPIIVRVLFVLLGGALFWIYILLWIIVPSRSIASNITKRLYRNPDDKILGGICGGLAVYFRVDTWIPRLIFVLPLVVGLFSNKIQSFFWDWGTGPQLFAGSVGSTLFILYIILWIALPKASTATNRMEMRGERIDINSIKAASLANAGYVPARRGSWLGRIIGILFKAFFLMIAAVIAVALFSALIAMLSVGQLALPYTDFLLDGTGERMLATIAIIAFFSIPLLALITWVIRRLMGVHSHRSYLGYIFTGLWIISFLGVITLFGMIVQKFNTTENIEEMYGISQPSGNKIYINVADDNQSWFRRHKLINAPRKNFSFSGPFYLVNEDSVFVNTVKVTLATSKDSMFHVYRTRISRGKNRAEARKLAEHIDFGIAQMDSVITLPRGFTVGKKDGYRNQQVLITVEVPVGKSIQVNKEEGVYNWFNVNVNGNNNFNMNSDDDDDEYDNSDAYQMTRSGLKSLNQGPDDEEDDDKDDEE